MQPAFIGSEIYRLEVFKPPHPLAMPRAMLVRDLCDALGWLPARDYFEASTASVSELCRFHTYDYISSLQRAEAEQNLPPETRAWTRIGADSNVIHPAVFRRPATSAGGALLAADLLAAGRHVQAPGVGNHHGFPDHASGFCFVNDIALLVLRLRDLGVRRVAYLDLDAHHGDGVEAAFADDAEVLTISVHEAGRWPRTGTVSKPEAAIWNFAVPAWFHDAELAWLWANKIKPLIAVHQPDIILFLPGADALADDKMSRLALSNQGLWAVAEGLKAFPVPLGVLGGGGYNPYALARCWAGLWAGLNGLAIPEILPPAAQQVLQSVASLWRPGAAVPEQWTTTLADAPHMGVIRDEILQLGD
jgi:acetoin utilization protein AcuC